MAKEMYTPPQLAVVEFGEEDVVVCSDPVTGGITGPGGIESGDGEDVWE